MADFYGDLVAADAAGDGDDAAVIPSIPFWQIAAPPNIQKRE